MRARGSERVGVFGQESGETSKRSPKEAVYRTGIKENKQKESKRGRLSDRNRGKQAKGVQKSLFIGQESRETSKRSPKKAIYRTGIEGNGQKESKRGRLSDRNQGKQAKEVRKSGSFTFKQESIIKSPSSVSE